MRRLLTGYAVTFNRRHRRCGRLFQNRYQSILCREDSCLRELARGKFKQTVKARSLLCYWGTRELGMATVALAGRLHLAQPSESQSALRRRKIALAEGLQLL
jgi:hypothetical protein